MTMNILKCQTIRPTLTPFQASHSFINYKWTTWAKNVYRKSLSGPVSGCHFYLWKKKKTKTFIIIDIWPQIAFEKYTKKKNDLLCNALLFLSWLCVCIVGTKAKKKKCPNQNHFHSPSPFSPRQWILFYFKIKRKSFTFPFIKLISLNKRFEIDEFFFWFCFFFVVVCRGIFSIKKSHKAKLSHDS